tara:strand:+ start:65 stop:205 length:141 start_codon:yes stop_codon:yes gene_type:complete
MKIDNIEISGTVSEVYPEDKVDLVKKAKGGVLPIVSKIFFLTTTYY